MERKLGSKTEHTRAILRNLACELIDHKQIRTTIKSAKLLREYVEPLITRAKEKSLHSTRILLSRLNNDIRIVNALFEIGSKHIDRNGGYTRIAKDGLYAYIQIV